MGPVAVSTPNTRVYSRCPGCDQCVAGRDMLNSSGEQYIFPCGT